MAAPTDTDENHAAISRTFLVVCVAGALVAWELGFELGAFENVSYRRLFAVCVVSTVCLVATYVTEQDGLVTTWWTRLVLALPAAYILADFLFLTATQGVADLLVLAILISFPYTLYVLVIMFDDDFWRLPRRLQVIAAITVVATALVGFYVGATHENFLTCDDFARVGDYLPDNCTP
ncbi:MAG: hypothetical protein AAF548_01760 [Actinomycetota bacterium]